MEDVWTIHCKGVKGEMEEDRLRRLTHQSCAWIGILFNASAKPELDIGAPYMGLVGRSITSK